MQKKVLAVVLILSGIGILAGLSLSSPTTIIEKTVYVTPQPAAATPMPETPTPVRISPPKAPDSLFDFQAEDASWRRIGQGKITLDVTGSIDYGGRKATPDSSPLIGDYTAKAQGIPFGAVIGKLGEEGTPFMIGSHKFVDTGSQILFIAINDSKYTDNYGAYHIRISKE